MSWKVYGIRIRKTLSPVYLIWGFLVGELILSLLRFQWLSALAALGTFVLTLVPFFVQRKFNLRIPNYFIVTIILFIGASIILGEGSGFYYKFWWWDDMLHGLSAVAFGIIGFVILLYLVQSSKIKASPFLISVFSFSFAVAIGAIWEIFEFAMDQTFGMNMQKSGLMDTMKDLIVDSLGGIVGAVSGYFYLKYGPGSVFAALVHPVIKENKKIFRTKITKIESFQMETTKPIKNNYKK